MSTDDSRVINQCGAGKSISNVSTVCLDATTSTAMSTNATYFVGFVAPVACVITKVKYIPDTAITGADTNSFNCNVTDRGSAGTGTSEMCAIDFVSGKDAIAFDALDFGTVSYGSLAADDTIAVQYQKVGNGLDAPQAVAAFYWRPQ